MTHNIDFTIASSETIIKALGKRLNDIRLSRNIAQVDLAKEAGVSRSTLTRLSDGKPVSLDSFVRIMQALRLTDHLVALLPDPGIRPVDRIRLGGSERQRASRRSTESSSSAWTWGDEGEDEA